MRWRQESRAKQLLLAETSRLVDRELDSRRALNSGLQQLIAFSGALLAISFAAGSRLGRLELDCVPSALLIFFFLGAVVGFVAVLLVAISALGPQKRSLANPEVLRYYAVSKASAVEMYSDLFEVEIDALEDLHEGNQSRAESHRLALRMLVIPLFFAAGGAITLILSS